METKIQKWGNSQGLRFPTAILKEADMRIGETVELKVRNGNIVIRPVRLRKKYKLEDLLARLPENYKLSEVEWGKASGREEW
ncbi:MAG: transcriptional regulator/antitoxin, MazE [Omnitrophica WOR_2 bacterium GWF2_38_59]|nr:MAG: transcriptional regulator/antitoxin, MazE [Omnitrophica WOR_2 bacterium GWF2_38_59]OGX50737.1 MAG: transcriptional regulator/antitoxin, MazE [Omnitrophica WOR_2 bacterium RIFOXYA2_FULL_38_17]OGX55536.1 MAG: transcriptional regulator/antitoxin, MazE [Omnitrophica WOR_2 bacterium RIFOXYC2_FULL_38_12]OGX59439.1 MAG: transcriptional regulator/antitoxin, MazE [Omnitrophica WOR_2 bacterium RIFOXYB2_FULL_38_16]HBG62259.1 transcriptional regulator/antitoxin, MazE [Candidatus Omnitrophota bacter